MRPDYANEGASVVIVSLGRLITVLTSAEALNEDITCAYTLG